jgi:hypothetical protein
MMTGSRQRTLVAVLCSVLMTMPGAYAKARKRPAPRKPAAGAVMTPALTAAIVSAVESGDPVIYNQPVAVIATHSGRAVRVVLETPPHNALGNAGAPVKLAVATYSGDSGAMESYPDHIPKAGANVDSNMPTAAGNACEQIAELGNLKPAFVLVVQHAPEGYRVIYSPIPYQENQTRIITVTGLGKGSSQNTAAPAEAPKLPPVKQG